jgi:hypothetical protein
MFQKFAINTVVKYTEIAGIGAPRGICSFSFSHPKRVQMGLRKKIKIDVEF